MTRRSRLLGALSAATLSDAAKAQQHAQSAKAFKLLRAHTIMGFPATPEWGGNQGMAGWSFIGLEHKAAFQPPFGFYDGEAK